MKHKLFLIEGLPCSGKSTTSQYIAELLKKQEDNVVWIDEGTGAHPADYEFQSYISENTYTKLDLNEKEKIKKVAHRKHSGYIVELNQLEGDLFDKMLQHKIYDFLTWDVEKELMLNKWKEFVDHAESNTIYVFNCCFLQNPMCETMIRFGYDIEVSKQHIESIAKIIEPLHPVCIYLESHHIEDRVNKTIDIRGAEWLNSVIEYHTLGEYGKEHGLSGFQGYISCLEERQRRELKILNGLNMDQLVVKQASENWNKAYSEMEKFIERLDKREVY